MKDIADSALDYLDRDPLLNMDMSEVIRRGTADVLKASSHGVLLFERESGAHMISADDAAGGEALLDGVTDCSLVTAHQHFLVEPVKKRYGLRESWTCFQTVYTHKDKLQVNTTFDIRPLELAHVETVAAHYRLVDAGEIGRLIRGGALLGGFSGETLAGFAGIHAEGGMGMLFVFPAFRRQGLAASLESCLINRQLDLGRVPFGQIFEDNTASLKLQESLGMTAAAGRIYWIY